MENKIKNDSVFINLSFLFLWLNICDIVLTSIALKNGCIEQNFIIDILYKLDYTYVIAFKAIIVVFLIVLLTVQYKKPNYSKTSFYLLVFLNIAYTLICVNNLYWILR